jgi:hypothetical protein
LKTCPEVPDPSLAVNSIASAGISHCPPELMLSSCGVRIITTKDRKRYKGSEKILRKKTPYLT